jgi:hypothetical protein
MESFINPNWSKAQQDAATAQMFGIAEKFTAAYEAFINEAPNPAAKQPVLNVLAEWREFNDSLSTTLNEQGSSGVDTIGPLAEQVIEQKQILKDLKVRAGTRDEQVGSLNPKTAQSPYVNLLGLQRTFRPGTRTAILWTGVAFGFLTLCVLSAMIYMFVVRGIVPTPTMVGGGGSTGSRAARRVTFALPQDLDG